MKVIFIDWKSFAKEDIKWALGQMGHQVIDFYHEDYDLRQSPEFQEHFRKACQEANPQAVFSSNFFPLVSDLCEELQIPYLAWVYDCPHVSLYSASVINKCNYVFLFDHETYQQLYRSGIPTVYYMPLAAPVERMDSLIPTDAIISKIGNDISFVGAMYNESHTLFQRLDGIDQESRGYLDALMEAQLSLAGQSFIKGALKGHLLEELRRVCPYKTTYRGVEEDTYIYASYFIERKLTEMERHRILKALSHDFSVAIFTHNPTPDLPELCNHGPVDYLLEMPYVFKCSKINLNITLRSIHSGIPLRAMDIMGAGGFLLTNYQGDFLQDFIPQEDYVYYENTEDLLEKCAYYLEHEEERLRIAQNGYKKVKAHHTYMARLEAIFSIVFPTGQ